MAEPTHDIATDSAPQVPVYRPVSGLAIAGFGLAVLCALIIGGIGLVAFFTGAPFLFPPLLVIALAAGSLSGAGLLRIARSEETRAGRGLALWGLMLSLLFGLGYGAYIVATEKAVGLQAEKFTREWFNLLHDGDADMEYLLTQLRIPPQVTGKVKSVAAGQVVIDDDGKEWSFREEEIARLVRAGREVRLGDIRAGDELSVSLKEVKLTKDAKLWAAFLMSLDPATRQSDSPLDYRHLKARYFFEQGGQGYLPSFELQPAVQLLRQAGPAAQFESLGLRNWTFEGGPQGGYRVEQVFRITTPMGHYTLVVPVLGRESRRGEFEGRRWHVLVTRIEPREAFVPTPLGSFLRSLQSDSVKAAEAWGRALENRELDAIYMETRRRQDQLNHLARLACTAIGSGTRPGGPVLAIAPLASSPLRRELFIRNDVYQQFPGPEFVRDEHFYANTEEGQQQVPKAVKAMLRGELIGERLQVRMAVSATQPSPIPVVSPWQLEGDELRFKHPMEVRFSDKYRIDAMVEVGTDDPEVIQKFRTLLQQDSTASAAPEGNNPLSPSASRRTGWRIVRLHLIDASSGGAGAPGQPAGPRPQGAAPGMMGPGGGFPVPPKQQ